MKDSDLITVCDNCLQAACWQGYFYCDGYKEAGTIEMTVKELKKLNYESSFYWEKHLRLYA